MNGDKAFFDTNILLYLYGGSDPGKQKRARELFRDYAYSSRLLLSTQVVQEFHAAAGKLAMPRRELREAAAALLECPLVVIGAAHILSALRIEERYQISFWDALILSTAESGGAPVLFSEDLQDGQQYGSVTVRNPFPQTEPV